MSIRTGVFAWTAATVLLTASLATAQPQAPAQPRRNPADPATWSTGLSKDYKAPDDVAFRTVSIMSEGVRLHGEMFTPKARAGQKLPTILMAHGWGGVASGFRADAVQLTRAGFQVLTFDYRGWGESDSRVILTAAEPKPLPPGRTFTAKVEAVRGYVDPWEQAEDWFNAINWASGEPSVDPDRIGIRGSSYSGGLVLYVAAHDRRVKALVSQVGGIASRPEPFTAPAPGTSQYERFRGFNAGGVRMARGELGYPEPGAQTVGSLIGAPIGNKTSRWWPAEDARQVTVPALFVLAEKEELVDNQTNGVRAYERVPGPKKLVIIPGIQHYGIYNQAREQAVDLAAQWFREHLK